MWASIQSKTLNEESTAEVGITFSCDSEKEEKKAIFRER